MALEPSNEKLKAIRGEVIFDSPQVQITRLSRFLVAALQVPHLVLSTSSRNGGQSGTVRFLINHQSCEGKDHWERQKYMNDLGAELYHDEVCGTIGIEPINVALMGTAANMNYASIIERRDDELRVIAAVTAGVQGNAACAGDPARWRERNGKWEAIPFLGTINTMLFINCPLTEGALARSVVTMTEGKSAALQTLAVGSLYSPELATGTGTDQYCVAAILSEGPRLTSCSPHVKLGEMVGTAVRDATLEALRWQNGLEPSYTRNIFHALGRFGLKELELFNLIQPQLSESLFELLKKNSNAVFHEPLVAAAAYAIASVLDRSRHGTLPPSAASEALRQHAATLAASLAARSDMWLEFHSNIFEADPQRPLGVIVKAIALGWSSKWR